MPPKDPGEVLATGGLANQTDVVVVHTNRAGLIDATIPSDGDMRTKERKTGLILGGMMELVERMLAVKTDNHKLLHVAFTLQN